MALPDTCPKCGEKATNDRGQCVFCGTQVVHPDSVVTPAQESRIRQRYLFASRSFVVLGVVYLSIGLVASAVYRKPLLGLLFTGAFALAHGWLLVVKNERVMSVTKALCLARMLVFIIFLQAIVPFLFAYILPGLLIVGLALYDLVCLFMMFNIGDDVSLG